jgi:ABC-2 type transport system ATP-binding protein
MIEVENLYKWYGPKLAVENISFKVSAGEILGFIGPNGAGKSTTMRIVTGYLPASKGSVKILGMDIDKYSVKAKKRMGYLPENAPLYSNMTVHSFLKFIAAMRGLRGKRAKEKIRDAADMCALNPVMAQITGTLSKGYRRRACLAQAILHDPDILILDEPTDGLDPNQKREVRKLIKDMGRTKAVILSTHILEEVEAVCGRVITIAGGKIIFDGRPEKMKQASPKAGNIIIDINTEDKRAVIEAFDNFELCDRVEINEKYEIVSIRLCPMKNIHPEKIKLRAAEICRDKSWLIDRLYIDSGNLDEVFYAMTRNDKEA